MFQAHSSMYYCATSEGSKHRQSNIQLSLRKPHACRSERERERERERAAAPGYDGDKVRRCLGCLRLAAAWRRTTVWSGPWAGRARPAALGWMRSEMAAEARGQRKAWGRARTARDRGRQVMQCRAGVLGRHQAGNECGVAGTATSTREPRTISHARDWVN